MVTILKNDDNFGLELGKALGSGLSSLAHHKINKLQDKHLENRLVKDGIQPQLASLLVSIGPKAREEYFKEQFDFHKFQNQPQQQQQQLPMQPQRPQQQPMQPVAQQNVPRDLQMANKPNTQDILRSLSGQGPQQPFGGMQPQQQPQQQQFAPQQQVQQQFGQQSPNQQFGQAAAQQQVAQQLQQQQPQPNNFSNVRENNSLQAKEEIAAQTRRKIIVEKYAEEKLNQGEEGERKLGILDKMDQLVSKVSGGTRSNLASLTGSRALLTSPETSEFDKLAADLLPQGLTQEQLRAERQKFPHAGLPEKANKRLIQELKKKYSKDIDEAYTTQSIIEANGGQVPEDFRKQLHYATKSQPTPELKKKESEVVAQQSLPNQVEPQEEGNIASAVRNVASAGAKSVSDVANLAALPEKLQKGVVQAGVESAQSTLNNPNVPEHLKKALRKYTKEAADSTNLGVIAPAVDAAHDLVNSYTQGYFKPKNEEEAVFQDYASMIPLFVMSGGNPSIKGISGFLARTATGRAVGEQVKEAGGGELGRIASEIVIPAVLSTLNPYRVAEKFKAIQNKNYNEVLPELAGDKSVDGHLFEQALAKSYKQGRRSAGRTRHAENINDWEGYLDSNGKFPLKELQPLKAEVNNLAYNQNNESYKPIAAALKQMGKDTLKSDPAYGKALEQSDYITKIYAGAQDMSEFLDDLTSTIPVTKKGLFKKGYEFLFKNPAVESAKNVPKLAVKYPKEFLKYSLESLKDAKNGNKSAFINSVSNIGRLVEDEE